MSLELPADGPSPAVLYTLVSNQLNSMSASERVQFYNPPALSIEKPDPRANAVDRLTREAWLRSCKAKKDDAETKRITEELEHRIKNGF